MDRNVAEKLPFSKVDHVGIVVRDMDKAIEYYQSLGIGPFKSLNLIVSERKIRGRTVGNVSNKIRLCQIGSIQLELLQPVEGESIQKEFLETRGEGVDHLGFFVNDIDREVAKLVKAGFKVITSVDFLNGGGVVYLDTGKVGGVLFELCYRQREYQGVL